MKVAFAILAWNESGTIASTIESIAAQSIVNQVIAPIEKVQIAVVVNGSTDGTAEVARQAFARFFPANDEHVGFAVFELPEPSRAAAWNAFVHSYSESDCDLIGFMDADIRLKTDRTLEILVMALWGREHAFVAGAKSVKHIESKKRKSLWDRLSLLGTSMEKKARLPFLAGQLYLGRASFWRKLYVPIGMCADDSMFTVLAWTNFQSEPIDPTRVVECQESEYIFEAYLTIPDLYRQHRRRNIGGVMHRVIWEYGKSVLGPNEDVGDLMTREYLHDPNWLTKKVQEVVRAKGIRIMNWKNLSLRYTQLRYQPLYKRLLLFPVSVLFSAWALIVMVGAYRTLKRGALRSLWTKTSSAFPQAQSLS